MFALDMFRTGLKFSLCRTTLVLAGLLTSPAMLVTASPRTGLDQSGRLAPGAEEPNTVQVSVRQFGGMPLTVGAMVKLSSRMGAVNRSLPTRDGGMATFENVGPGDYDLEVSSPGYKTDSTHISVFGTGTSFPVFVYLHPESDPTPSAGAPSSGTVMSPKLQNEVDKGMNELRKRKYDKAQQIFKKAAKQAPGNPDIQYLLGMVEYGQNRLDGAREYFNSALSLNPSHQRSLLALGELELRSGNASAAKATLQKCYQLHGGDWRTHFLLAYADLETGQLTEAKSHARSALELGKDQAAQAKPLLQKIELAEKKRTHVENLALAASVREGIAEADAQPRTRELASPQRKAEAEEKRTGTRETSVPEPPTPPARPWAPLDIDEMKYPVAAGVTCDLASIVARTQIKMRRDLANFEKFTATERIDHQKIDANGIRGPVRERDFSYLVFIRALKDGDYYLEESRDGGEGLDSFPTSLATTGLFSLAVNVFKKAYQKDFEFKCEGLSHWRGRATWQIRFEQAQTVPSRIRAWRTAKGLYDIPLKGRVWLSAENYNVLHLETDLREAIDTLELRRDHLSIDYGPVTFEQGKTVLWLPWQAEMYLDLHGRHYYHRHTLSHYLLFSVDTENKAQAPKQASNPQKQQ